MSITKLDCILHSLSSHHQADAVHLDFNAASGLMHDCLNWFQSYLTARLFLVKLLVFFVLEYFLKSHKALCLGAVCFNIFIDAICVVINHSKYMFLVGDIRFFHVVKSCHWMFTITVRY